MATQNLRNNLYILLSFLVGSTGLYSLAEELQCSTEASSNKLYMNTIYDGVGFCGPMALRAHLHQFRCKSDPKNCKLPSVLELVKLSREVKAYDSDANRDKFMQSMGVGIRLKDESCVPVEKLFKPYDGNLPNYDWGKTFTFYQLRALGMKIAPTEDLVKDNWNTIQVALKLTRETVYKDVLEQKFSKLLEIYLKENQCKTSPIPPFEYKAKPFSVGLLISQLKSGHEAEVNLWIKQPGSQKLGSHAILITNYKKTCCANLCTTMFQTIDSLGTYWAPENRGKDWVSEKDLLGAVTKDATIITFQEPNRSTPNPIVKPVNLAH